MAEDIQASESPSEVATATALALAGASRAEADAFLRDQRHHLREQFKQLRYALWEKRLGVLLRVATLVVGLAFAGGLGWRVWDAAAHSSGLIIEPFAVPADMAAKGLTGQVIASQMLDKPERRCRTQPIPSARPNHTRTTGATA